MVIGDHGLARGAPLQRSYSTGGFNVLDQDAFDKWTPLEHPHK